MNTATILSGVLFGGIGFAAFVYGKKQREAKPMIVGALLMAYPYFISNVWVQVGVGIALTALLFFPR